MGLRRTLVSWCGRHWLTAHGVAVGPGLVLYGLPIVSRCPGSRIVLGHRVALCSSPRYNPVGVNHPVILRTLTPESEIIIGDDTGLSGAAICAAISVRIGAQCLLGANVTVTDCDFHPVAAPGRRFINDIRAVPSAPVIIEQNVWIGMNTIVLKGVQIGAHSVIAAGSVVTSSIPSSCIAAGVPARVVRELRPDERDNIEQSAVAQGNV
ncbi:MAG: acyltransferase [bacterium]|nr:acyltransferase [bacterium]